MRIWSGLVSSMRSERGGGGGGGGPLAAEMEEAYNELYQEFLRLRSLCLRQAALLHQLTAALQKQQGAAALPNGDLNDMMSIAMLAADRPSLVTDFMSLSGGMLMSDVVLQSHVCDFCQAVFPRDSTTKGEFLRHLHTHVP
ncbi:hypothetical protein INR49_030995 [Caranx melampygus]|nr:hypothetical protein INR49_030995 [Caranx melampygus]